MGPEHTRTWSKPTGGVDSVVSEERAELWAYLEAGDGSFASLNQHFIDPGHDGVVSHFLSITELLQDVQGVSEET